MEERNHVHVTYRTVVPKGVRVDDTHGLMKQPIHSKAKKSDSQDKAHSLDPIPHFGSLSRVAPDPAAPLPAHPRTQTAILGTNDSAGPGRTANVFDFVSGCGGASRGFQEAGHLAGGRGFGPRVRRQATAPPRAVPVDVHRASRSPNRAPSAPN